MADRLFGCVMQRVEIGFLRVGRLDHVLDLVDRQVGEAGLGLLAALAVLRDGAGRLRHCLATCVGPELVEALLLLVAQRIVERLERRLDGVDRLQRGIEPAGHGGQPARRREREGVVRPGRRP